MHYYYLIYKPYLILSQFTSQTGKQTLADIFKVPKDVYPVGRLDADSEGLLILTNDASLNQKLLNPTQHHEREYWVQVEGSITHDAITYLQKGVAISVVGKVYKTLPCKAKIITQQPFIADRNPPIRFRKNIPTSWVSITLTEGKNRQVRKMTAAVGFPTLRLIRWRIEKITLDKMIPGNIIEVSKPEIFKRLSLT